MNWDRRNCDGRGLEPIQDFEAQCERKKWVQ